MIQPKFVARTEVENYFPGLNAKTLSNMASLGKGPKIYRPTGGKVFYKMGDLEKMFSEGGKRGRR
ncbi:hypothetical protein UR09_02910 [Candidatus Nitromaritima sp. SCGC AAA799-A02]|nr:hypothetical protein UR09_02910 [Candidatus Nitromaritima sp. SCGC AAA799-A02]